MEMDVDFMKLAAERYSVRKFKPEPVRGETLERILRAGRLAPTACNLQPQRVLAIEGEEAAAKLRGRTKCRFDAPTALLAMGYPAPGAKPYPGHAAFRPMEEVVARNHF